MRRNMVTRKGCKGMDERFGEAMGMERQKKVGERREWVEGREGVREGRCEGKGSVMRRKSSCGGGSKRH